MNSHSSHHRGKEDILMGRLLKNWISREHLPNNGKERLLNAVAKQAIRQNSRFSAFHLSTQHNPSLDIAFMTLARATGYSLQTCISIL